MTNVIDLLQKLNMCPIRGDLFLSQDEEMSLFFIKNYTNKGR